MIRIFRYYIPKWLLVLGTTGAAILFAALCLGASVRLLEFDPGDKPLLGLLGHRGVAFAVVMVTLMTSVGLYQRGLCHNLEGLLLRLTVAVALGWGGIMTLLALFPFLSVGTQGLGITFALSLLSILALRMVKYSGLGALERWIFVLWGQGAR